MDQNILAKPDPVRTQKLSKVGPGLCLDTMKMSHPNPVAWVNVVCKWLVVVRLTAPLPSFYP